MEETRSEEDKTADLVESEDNGGPAGLVDIDVDGMWRFLDALVPTDKNSIQDCKGNEYSVPIMLPARRQIGVLRELKKLWDGVVPAEGGQDIVDRLSGGNFDIATMVSELIDLIGDEKVLGHVDKAFALAFPEILENLEGGAADNFAIEEVVGGLLPFFVRMMKKMLGVTRSL